MAEKPQEDALRWTAKRRVALVVSIIRGETSAQQAARKHGLKVPVRRSFADNGWRRRCGDARKSTFVRAAAGAKLQRIAAELGVTVPTLQQWMRPPPANGPVKLRPVCIIGPINNSVAELTGPRLVLPSGVQIVGLDVDQMTTLMKRLG